MNEAGGYNPTHCDVYRVNSGDVLTDYGRLQIAGGGDGGETYVAYEFVNGVCVEKIFYFYVVDDLGDPILLSDVRGYNEEVMYAFMRYHLDNLVFTASSGDIGVNIFDAIAERIKTWVLAALIFAGSFLCAKFGFREILRFAGTGLGGKSGAASLTSASSDVSDDCEAKKAERENFEAFKRSWDAIRELGAADAYATGEAYGLTFTAKVVKSNQILQESWSRLSEDERQFLTNEARALAWQDDLIDEKERIYRQTVMETAFVELDGVDASEMFSNSNDDETSDEDDDPEPVPRPGAAPLPYVALEEDEDDGLTFPIETSSVPNRPYREIYDDYDAANRALDESYYDDEGGYW
ncbi:MAG: hypothetical protein IIW01_08190 [Thermoguttaceae bacterium]|nr:hypothetical protein [Thermoguttaceae bacterium]